MSPARDDHVHFPEHCQFVYERNGVLLHLKLESVTNHELRNILIGMWLTLDRDDQEDMIRELDHYLLPASSPPISAQIVADAIRTARADAGRA